MIRVNENYCIDVDEKCYTVKIDKHKEDKNGTPIFETVGYFSSLETAIKGVIISMNRKQLKDGIYTLKEALEIVQENNRKFNELLEEVVRIKGE